MMGGVKPVKIKLEKAGVKEIPALAGFLRELFKLEADFSPDLGRQVAAIEAILDNPQHAIIYVIKVDGEVAGMVALHLSISTAEGGWAGRIEDLYLRPEFRRRGIGRQAINEIVAIAADKGLKRITLVADKDNLPAHEFYTRYGFEEMNLVSFIKKFD